MLAMPCVSLAGDKPSQLDEGAAAAFNSWQVALCAPTSGRSKKQQPQKSFAISIALVWKWQGHFLTTQSTGEVPETGLRCHSRDNS